jgi:hypothetical protein
MPNAALEPPAKSGRAAFVRSDSKRLLCATTPLHDRLVEDAAVYFLLPRNLFRRQLSLVAGVQEELVLGLINVAEPVGMNYYDLVGIRLVVLCHTLETGEKIPRIYTD